MGCMGELSKEGLSDVPRMGTPRVRPSSQCPVELASRGRHMAIVDFRPAGSGTLSPMNIVTAHLSYCVCVY